MKELRNFHLPLPDDLYARLRAEAERTNQPATMLARQAIEAWLGQRRKTAMHKAISAYAARHGGSHADLDPVLESAALELLASERRGAP